MRRSGRHAGCRLTPLFAAAVVFGLGSPTFAGMIVGDGKGKATDDCLALMRRFPSVRAVFHCFTGTPAEARKILDQGYLLGFTGAVTFKKADVLREAVRLTPLDRMVVETDAPYLSPEPMRKQNVNEPALVVHVAEVVAREKGVGVVEIDRVTTENAGRFFGWP